jgi:hypothetical protein
MHVLCISHFCELTTLNTWKMPSTCNNSMLELVILQGGLKFTELILTCPG